MLGIGSLCFVSDNSGVSIVKCIQIFGSSKNSVLSLGFEIIAIVKSLRSIKRFQKKMVIGALVYGVLIRLKNNIFRFDGSCVFFFENSIVLIKNRKNKDIVGTRIIGIVFKELRRKFFNKIVTLSSGYI